MFSAPCFTFSSMANCFSRPATRLRLVAEQVGPPAPGDWGPSTGHRWERVITHGHLGLPGRLHPQPSLGIAPEARGGGAGGQQAGRQAEGHQGPAVYPPTHPGKLLGAGAGLRMKECRRAPRCLSVSLVLGPLHLGGPLVTTYVACVSLWVWEWCHL